MALRVARRLRDDGASLQVMQAALSWLQQRDEAIPFANRFLVGIGEAVSELTKEEVATFPAKLDDEMVGWILNLGAVESKVQQVLGRTA